MTNESLLTLADQRGHKVLYESLAENDGFSLDIGNGHVVLSKRLSGAREKEQLAHELGHCEYGGFYNRYSPYEIAERAERRADKWAYSKLLPPREVLDAFHQGICEPWELAELFDVSCEYVQKALECYRSAMVI